MRKFKFTLQRKTLETIYTSYVRPVLEYGNTVMCNISLANKTRLENIQLTAARIVCGAVKGTIHERLYNELKWQTLESRRIEKQLHIMYKMHKKQTPPYLYLHVNKPHQQTYQLRNQNTCYIEPQMANKTLYQNSFLPSTINLWNNLNIDIKNCESFKSFKEKLKTSPKQNDYFYKGSRIGQIFHARLRMKCSDLNSHLVDRHISDNRSCSCGYLNENNEHYLLYCPNYERARNHLSSISVPINTDILLFGKAEYTDEINKHIFLKVQSFILESRRFENEYNAGYINS